VNELTHELEESRQLLRETTELERIVEASSAVLYRCVATDDGSFIGVYVSPSIADVLGYECHECLQSGWWMSHIHPDDLRMVTGIQRTLPEQGSVAYDYRFACQDGTYRWVHDRVRYNAAVAGKPAELLGSWLDITDIRQARQRSYENEEMYRTLVEQSFDGIVILAADGSVVFANQACADSWGGTVDELAGQSFLNILHPDVREQMSLYFEQRMAGGGPANYYETRMLRKRGEIAWVEVTGRLITWQGHPADLLTLRDISERKASNIALQTSERRFRTLFEESPLSMQFINPAGFTAEVNKAWKALWHAELSDISGLNVLKDEQLIAKGVTSCLEKAFAGEVVALPSIYFDASQSRGVSVKLSSCWVRSWAYPVADDQGDIQYIVLVHEDITARKQAEISLSESEQRYRTLFESSKDAIMILDATAACMDCNAETLALYGCATRDEIIGKTALDFSPTKQACGTDSSALAMKYMSATVKNGSCRFEWLNTRLDGSKFHTDVSLTVLGTADQMSILCSVRDITELKQNQALLERRERQLAVLAEAGKTINESLDQQQISRKLVDYALRLVDCESGAVGIYSNDAMLFFEYATGGDYQAIEICFPAGYGVPGHVLETRKPYISNDARHDEHVIPEIQQHFSFIKLIDVPILDAEGDLLGCFEMHDRLDGADFDDQDLEMVQSLSGIVAAALINARQQTEITQAAERMRLILDADFDAVIVHQDFKVVFCNRYARELFGYDSLVATLGQDVLQAFIPEQRCLAVRAAQRAIRTGQAVGRVEMLGLSRSRSEPFPMEIASAPILWRGKPAVVSIVRDISERKAAMAELERERAAMRAILNNIPFVAWLKDEQNRFVLVNNQFAEACGAGDAEELIGKDDFDICPEELAGVYRRDDLEVMQSMSPKRTQENVIIKGEVRSCETYKSPVFAADGSVAGTAGITLDITDRLKNQTQLQLLESAVGSVNESIIITDADGVIVYVNPSFETNTGFSVEDAIGKTPAILNSKQQSKAFYLHFWQTLKSGSPWAGRIMDRRKDGTIFPVYLSVAPIFDQQGSISHFVAVHEDLTKTEALQKKLMQSQKMESVGTMAGGIAHDFNNLLAGLIGNMYLMRLHHSDDVEIIERTTDMESSMRRAATMIQQMLTFSRKDRPEMHDMDLRTFIKEAHRLSEASLPENIAFSLDYPARDETWVHADASQLQQVLLNLITNARHAVKNNDHAVISVALSHAEPDTALLLEHAEAGGDYGWCCLQVTDNGCGIAAEDMEHIFDPFFTTRGVGEGTGLGLAMVYGAVQNHQGLIDVQSVPGEGCCFSIYLPMRQMGEGAVIRGEDTVIDGRGKGILLVDDEDGLRQVLADVLGHNGFTVWQASDGEQAVDLFRKYGQQIDLVLTDVVMPNKGGVAAAAEIRELDADVPIIFQTGYGEATQLEAAASIEHSVSLQKPVVLSELLKLIDIQTGSH